MTKNGRWLAENNTCTALTSGGYGSEYNLTCCQDNNMSMPRYAARQTVLRSRISFVHKFARIPGEQLESSRNNRTHLIATIHAFTCHSFSIPRCNLKPNSLHVWMSIWPRKFHPQPPTKYAKEVVCSRENHVNCARCFHSIFASVHGVRSPATKLLAQQAQPHAAIGSEKQWMLAQKS